MSTYFVSSSGNDSNTGSSSNPWLTLQHAVNSMVAGDTTNVMPGTYAGARIDPSNGNGVTGTSGSPITLQANPGSTSTQVAITTKSPIDIWNTGISFNNVSYWTCNGLYINNASGNFTSEGMYIPSPSTHIAISNCTFSQCGNSGGQGGILISGNYNTVTQCTFANSPGHGMYFGNGGSGGQTIIGLTFTNNILYGSGNSGLQINGCADDNSGYATGCLVTGNIFYNNSGHGVEFDGVTASVFSNNIVYGWTLYGLVFFTSGTVAGSTNNVVVNNTFYAAGGTGYEAIDLSNTSTGNTFFNNILIGGHGNGAGSQAFGVSAASLPGFSSNYNIIGTVSPAATFSDNGDSSLIALAAWRTATGQDANSFPASLVSLFTNYSSNIYTEATGSPSIAAGVAAFNSHSAPTTDILGNPRPSGSGYDIGAYQSVGAPSMADEYISQLTEIAAPTGTPPYPTAFTNPSTGAMLEILDTTNTSMAPTGTNSRIAPGDLLKGFLNAGSNVTITETAGIVTIAGASGLPATGSNGQILTVASGAPIWAAPLSATNVFAVLASNYSSMALNTFSNVGVSITLSAGTWMIFGLINASINFSGTPPNYAFINSQLYDTSNSTIVPGTAINPVVANIQIASQTISFQNCCPLGPVIYTPTIAPATLQLQGNYDTNGTYVSSLIIASNSTSLCAVRIS